jgi:hypothetical protein
VIDYEMIPATLMGSLRRYIEHRIPPGDFLLAVLRNDLREACARADEDSQRAIFHVVGWLYNEAPYGCWGSTERVEEWLRKNPANNRGSDADAEAGGRRG